MRIRNLTELLVGFRVTSRRPPTPEMSIVVRGVFDIVADGPLAPPSGLPLLAQGFLKGDAFAPDDEERAGECLYPSDFADYKPRADVILRGSCHTPGGEPLTECPVRFAVGGWSKILRVVGPRVWVPGIFGDVPSKPLPFTRMPIGYDHAFGGPGHAPNPVGKGFGTAELPNVSGAGDVLESRGDRPAPAGFGPINPAWPQRAKKLGEAYGRSYAARAPYYAEDFDWSYFNAAPEDQQLQGFLRGDEDLLFQNLHAAAPLLRTRLPALHVRVFVNDVAQRFREVAMSLDTLFADTDAGTVTLSWRGLTPVQEDDLKDVQTVLVASEAFGEAPQSKEHYRAIVEEFERDPVRASIPEEMREGWDALTRKPKDEATEDASLDPVSALLKQRMGGFAADAQASITQAIARLAEKAAGPAGVNLNEALAKALQKPWPALAPPVLGAPMRDARLGEAYQRIARRVADFKRHAEERGIPIPELIEKFEKLPDDPKIAALGIVPFDPDKRPEEPVAPGPGRDLSGQDLTGRDLAGQDLTGANLEGTLLAGANLRGAKLAGANLRRAVLTEADLSGADLANADLSQASAAGLRATGADLSGARLDRALLEKADFSGARLVGATAEQALFLHANLEGVDAAQATLRKCLFHDASLRRARLGGATLDRSSFTEASAVEADLTAADVTGSGFDGVDLTKAHLQRVHGERSVWTGATLEGADLSHASLPHAHFAEVRAGRARFVAADLRWARFYRAALEGADLRHANLFQADLGKAKLDGARFGGASLYDAKLLGAETERSDFAGANLKRSTLERS